MVLGPRPKDAPTTSVNRPELSAACSRLEHVFEYEWTAQQTDEEVTRLVDATYRHLVDAETTLLELAAHWADRHTVDPSDPHYSPTRTGPGVEQSRRIGGPGTPMITEYAAAELGTLQETTTGAAVAQMADALDLRHRLPHLWTRIQNRQVRVWKARTVAKATRHLTEEAAAHVDRVVTDPITTLPWNRFETLLDAAIIEADPAGAEEQAKIWAAQQFVRTGMTREHGLKLLIARANAGDVITFMAMINRLAEILHVNGNTDTADVRRARAIGIIAQPALALTLLCSHRDDADRPEHGPEPVNDEETVPDAAGRDDPEAHEYPSAAGGPSTPTTEPHTSVHFTASPDWDLSKAKPTVTLYVHLSAEALQPRCTCLDANSGTDHQTGHGNVARIEGIGPVTEQQIRHFLRTTHATIRVQPVLDPDPPPVDAYEIPHRTREGLRLRNPAEIFPYGSATGRSMDIDHTTAFTPPDHGGPPGQTSMNNLGPLSRSHHRLKTFSRWRVRQPAPGTFVWRSPNGWVHLVTSSGTTRLGHSDFAAEVWEAASGVQREEHLLHTLNRFRRILAPARSVSASASARDDCRSPLPVESMR